MARLLVLLIALIVLQSPSLSAQTLDAIPARVDFGDLRQAWDGFGFNYVENAQLRTRVGATQDLGGFSRLDDAEKATIVEAVFGADGLDIDIVKLFLDPWHQKDPGGAFDHVSTTRNMLEFVEAGVAVAKKRGKEIQAITTLYGPPPWATMQKRIGGRDLDPDQFVALADYMIEWAKFLRSRGIAVKYLSIHNEGEDFYRWDYAQGSQRREEFDYNAYWPPQQVNSFIRTLSERLEHHGLSEIGVTNGEPSNWTRFRQWGYADALANDAEVIENLDLITTHGFIKGDFGKLSYGTADSYTTDLLRSKKPGLHAWVTSYAWGKMDNVFTRHSHEHIYLAKVNALIPWAGIQNPSQWLGPAHTGGHAVTITDDGKWKLTPGYYLYKQLTHAGRRGTRVAHTEIANPVSALFAFAGAESGHPDAFVVVDNIAIWGRPFRIEIANSKYSKFAAFRSSENSKEQFQPIGEFNVDRGAITYDPPKGTVTTFIGIE